HRPRLCELLPTPGRLPDHPLLNRRLEAADNHNASWPGDRLRSRPRDLSDDRNARPASQVAYPDSIEIDRARLGFPLQKARDFFQPRDRSTERLRLGESTAAAQTPVPKRQQRRNAPPSV